MRQDRRLNGWILISSILQIILGLVLISGGVALGIGAFMFFDKLLKIKDLQFFLGQKFFTQFKLKPEYLHLYTGIAVGVIGLLTLIFGIITLMYAKKKKVVRRRGAIIMLSLIPLAIAGCVATYLVFEWKAITNYITYIAYGVGGSYEIVWLFNMFGVIFGRSEKFMSNDNGKYAFDNGSLRNARADANNNVRTAQAQQPMSRQAQPSRAGQPMMRRPIQPGQQPNMVRRVPTSQTRPAGAPMQNRPTNAPTMAPRPNGVRPINASMQGQPMRPAQATVRPISRPVPNPIAQSKPRYCPKCGKLLNPGETSCTLCGWSPSRQSK